MTLPEMIRISKELKTFLNKKKRYHRETYDDIIKRMVRYGNK